MQRVNRGGRPVLTEEARRDAAAKLEQRALKSRVRKIPNQFRYTRIKAQKYWNSEETKGRFLLDFDNVISRTLAYKLVNKNIPDDDFTTLVQYAFIGSIFQIDRSDVAAWIHRKFEDYSDEPSPTHRNSGDRRIELSGEYRCYYLKPNNHVEERKIIIYKELNDFRFEMFIKLLSGREEIYCTGICIIIKDKMILIGFEKDKLHFSALRIPSDLETRPLAGACMDIFQSYDGKIANSMFIMVHGENKNDVFNTITASDIKNFFDGSRK